MTSSGVRGLQILGDLLKGERESLPLCYFVVHVGPKDSARFLHDIVVHCVASRKLISTSFLYKLMNPQRKRISSSRQSVNQTEEAITVVNLSFDDAPAVNVHGVNITLGVSPFGPDETLVGRWYVAVLPPSIENDATILSAWLDNLNTISLANAFLATADYIWGAGSIVVGEQSTFQLTFNPKTSRNINKGGRIRVIAVADAISGVADDWDSAGTISCFSTS